jgi:hypothetical protein
MATTRERFDNIITVMRFFDPKMRELLDDPVKEDLLYHYLIKRDLRDFNPGNPPSSLPPKTLELIHSLEKRV